MVVNIQDLLDAHGSITAIPEAALAEAGFARVEQDGTMRLARIDTLAQEEGRLLGVLHNRAGYLSPCHRSVLRQAADREITITQKEFEWIRAQTWARMERFPPLWQPEYETLGGVATTHHPGGQKVDRVQEGFPVIDLLLQFGSGNYFWRRQLRGREMHKGKKRGIEPATIEDVELFRQRAFDGDSLVPGFGDYFHVWTDFHFEMSDERREMLHALDTAALAHLERELDPLPGTAKTRRFDGDLSLILEPCWFLDFPPEERERALAAYLPAMQETGTRYSPRNERGLELYRSMQALFPGALTVPAEKDPAIVLQVERALATEEYRGVDHVVYADPLYATERARVLKAITTTARRRFEEEPTLALSSISVITEQLQLPKTHDSTVARIVDEQRVTGAKLLDDTTFLVYAKGRILGTLGGTFANYVSTRRDRLRS